MIRLSIILCLFILASHTNGQSKVLATISIPQGSGLAAPPFKIFRIQEDTMFVLYRTINFTGILDTNDTNQTHEPFFYDTLEIHTINKADTRELADLLAKTDSLGHHTTLGCMINMGWPRFLIYANDNGRTMQGFVAHCYREHIYRIVDLFNKAYPKGDVLTYDKSVLIAQEAECNKQWEKDLKKSKQENEK